MWKDLFPAVWEALRQLLLFMHARTALTTANGILAVWKWKLALRESTPT